MDKIMEIKKGNRRKPE